MNKYTHLWSTFFSVFAVNEYTAPAIFMALATATLFYLLYIYFEDAQKAHQNDGKKKLSARRQACQDLHDEPVCCGQLTKHTLCLIACMFLNVFVKGPMSCFETLGVEFANSTFNMPREEAGMIVAFAGFLGAMNLLILRISITQYYTDIQIIMFGYSMFIVGILTNLFLDMDDSDNNSKWMYALSIFFIYSVGYPVCHVALIGFFSKGTFITLIIIIRPFTRSSIQSVKRFLNVNCIGPDWKSNNRHSCWTETSRDYDGFVRSLWLLFESIFPCFLRVYCSVQGHWNIVLLSCSSTQYISIDSILFPPHSHNVISVNGLFIALNFVDKVVTLHCNIKTQTYKKQVRSRKEARMFTCSVSCRLILCKTFLGNVTIYYVDLQDARGMQIYASMMYVY